MLTLLSLTCIIDGCDRNGRPILNYATGALAPLKRPDTLLNWIALSNSTTGKYAPMQAVKQPGRGRASDTEERNRFSFRQTMINVTPQVLQAKIVCLQNVI